MDDESGVYSYNGYYSIIKGNKLLIHTTKCKNLRNTVLSERSLVPKSIMLCDCLSTNRAARRVRVGSRDRFSWNVVLFLVLVTSTFISFFSSV